MSPLNLPDLRSERIALCYVRLSWTREGDDNQSPDRQRANISRKCQEDGLTPIWFEDVDGHKSGREVSNRPGWKSLVSHLDHPNVVAVVANDLSRLHRKGWRIGKLLDTLEQRNIALITAAPGKEIDTSTSMGKFIINITATFDEQYADDIADKVKDGIRHRKAKGKTVGRPPFGTLRDEHGFLIPNRKEGAWWMVDGSYGKGDPETSPADGAVWRTYFMTAERILWLYADGELGAEALAYCMNEEGYPFRDRKGNPRVLCRDDVRRVLANWPEYGGLVLDQKAKDRDIFTESELQDVQLDPERAVFPIDLLKRVAQVRCKRAVRPVDRGHKRTVYPYPLSYITRCAHCEARATEAEDPMLQTNLNGTNMNNVRRYRHKPGLDCGCEKRSVKCEELEEDFGRLIKGLTVNEEALQWMVELADTVKLDPDADTLDPELERQRSMERIKKKIRNVKTLFAEGHIEVNEFRERMEENERELAYWEKYTTQREQAILELTRCLDVIDQVANLWDIAEPKERQLMARNLFDFIVYNLDEQRIVDFRLKPWADRFLVLRAALYEDSDRNKKASPQEVKRNMPHTGLETLLRFYRRAAKTVLNNIFIGQSPRILQAKTLLSRNQRIQALYAEGELLCDIAQDYGISSQRVWQIVQGQ